MEMKMKITWKNPIKNYSAIAIFVVLASCSKNSMNEKTAQAYFNKMASSDFMETEEYLSSSFVYEDVIFKQEYEDKTAFIQSLVPDPQIKYQCEKNLSIDNISAANDSMVYVQGIYCAYTYKDKEIDPMRFVSILYFNKDGKIQRQEDWKDHSLEGIISMYQFRASTLQYAE